MGQDFYLKQIYESMLASKPQNAYFSAKSKNLQEAYANMHEDQERDLWDYITFDEDPEEQIEELWESSRKKFGTREERYIERINKMLQSNTQLEYGIAKDEVLTFTPNRGQIIGSLTDKIKGVDDAGTPVQVQASNLYKDPSGPNKGEVAEGLLGVTLFKRFTSSKSVTPNDVIKELTKLSSYKNGQEIKVTRNWTQNNIADTFELTIRLKDRSMDGLLDVKWVQSKMKKILPQICNFVNAQSEKYARYFQTNEKADSVFIKSDGVTGEGGLKNIDQEQESEISKTDVQVYVKDAPTPENPNGSIRPLTHLNLSVKTGTTKQLGQYGGGRTSDTLEQRFDHVVPFWSRFGVDVTPIKSHFIKQPTIFDAYRHLYKFVSKQLNSTFAKLNEDAEKNFLNTLVKALNFFGAANQKNLKLVQFTERGFYALDFNKTNRLLESDAGLDFKCIYSEGSSGMPQIDIINTNSESSKNIFLRIRTYKTSQGYLRNYVEKGPLLVKLLKSKTL